MLNQGLIYIFCYFQESRPLSLVKDTIQTRNRKVGKAKAACHESVSSFVMMALDDSSSSSNHVYNNNGRHVFKADVDVSFKYEQF